MDGGGRTHRREQRRLPGTRHPGEAESAALARTSTACMAGRRGRPAGAARAARTSSTEPSQVAENLVQRHPPTAADLLTERQRVARKAGQLSFGSWHAAALAGAGTWDVE